MRLTEMLVPGAIKVGLEGASNEQAIRELASLLCEGIAFRSVDTMVRLLMEREELGSTAVGEGVAIPHARVPGLKAIRVALGISKNGIDFHAPDKKTSHLILLLVGPADGSCLHLKALARIARMAKDDTMREKLLRCGSPEQVQKALVEAEAKFLAE